MAYSELPSRFTFILLNPQREVVTVPADDRGGEVVVNDRTVVVPRH